MAYRWVYSSVIFIAAFAIYTQGIGDFYLFDSKLHLLENTSLFADFTSASDWLAAMDSSKSGPTGRPVAMLSFALERWFTDTPEPTWSKLINLWLHLSVGFVLYLLTLRMVEQIATQSSEPARLAMALCSAGIWLLHPIQTSTVLYAIQRMEVLSALFVLLGLLAFLSYRKLWLSRVPTAQELADCSLLVILCLALAVLSKENGIILLPLIALLEASIFSFQVDGRERPRLRLFVYLSLFIPLAIFCFLLIYPPTQLIEAYSIRPFDLHERVLTQSRLLWEYLSWMLLPDIRPLALHHDDILLSRDLMRPPSTSWSVLGWIVVLLLFVTSLWRQWRLPALAIGWFIICHSVESTLLPLELAYEHRNYLALASVCWLAAWLIWQVWPKASDTQRLTVSAVLIGLLCVQLFSRVTLWQDEEQLSAYHLTHHPTSKRSIYHYANTQLRLAELRGEGPEVQAGLTLARHYYQRLYDLSPDSFTALVTLFYLDERYFSSFESERWAQAMLSALESKDMLRIGDAPAFGLLLRCQIEAFCALETAQMENIFKLLIARQPNDPVYPNLHAIYRGEVVGDMRSAIDIHTRLIERFPEYVPAYIGLATWLDRSGADAQSYEVLRNLLGVEADITRVKLLLNSFKRAVPGDS